MDPTQSPSFVTLGMFIIDEFSFLDKEGLPTGRSIAPQESQASCDFAVCLMIILPQIGGGVYTAIGARIW